MRVRAVRKFGVVLAVCAAAGLMSTALAGAATDTGIAWGPPIPLTLPADGPVGQFESVSCTGAGDCVAVGSDQPASDGSTESEYGLVAVESDGAWSTPLTLSGTSLPINAQTATNEEDVLLTSVSCYSTTACMAVGTYEDTSDATEAFAVPITLAGTSADPGTAAEITLPSGASDPIIGSVSCSSSGSCTATGDLSGSGQPLVATSTGSWDATEIPASDFPTGYVGLADEGLSPLAVSCPPSGTCTAVGAYVSSSNQESAFELPLTANNGTSGTPTLIADPVGTVTPANTEALAISCPAAGACTVTGDFYTSTGVGAFAAPITNGVPGTPAVLTSPAGSQLNAGFGISCADASDCDLVGVSESESSGVPLIVTDSEVAGAWGPLTAVPSEDAGGVFAAIPAISCTATSACVVTGETGSSDEYVTPFLAPFAPQLSITTSSLPAATVGVPYSATLQAIGASGATWSVSAGSLPAGLSLNGATGVISGTPTSAVQDGFVVADSQPGPPAQTATSGLSINVAAAATTTTPPTTVTTPPTTVTTPATTVTTPATTVTVPAAVTKPAVAKPRITKLSSKGAKVTVTVACADATCKGTLLLSAVEHLSGSKVMSVTEIARAGAKTKTETVTLAKGTYSVSAGKTKTITLTLNATGAKLLTARRRFTAKLTYTPSGSKTATITKTVALTAVRAAR